MKTKINDSKNLPLPTGEGRSCSRGTRRTNSGEGANRNAFTLAEVLITLGVIGVVAALTMPALLTNIQENINKEKVRTVKYKLTQATDKMKSQDLIGPYETSMDFVNELKKHLSIAKVCDDTNLAGCWPSGTVNTNSGAKNITSITKGSELKALALGTAQTKTVGIVTGDGTPMILVYSPVCTPLDPVKSYTWSVVDGKPETNATTNCISAIFDINGAKGPNKIGTDVRTFNSLYGSVQYSAQYISKDECTKRQKELGLKWCYDGNDYYAGAVKACHDIGLHLPSMQTLANIAGAKYGRSDIGTYTLIMKNGYGDYDDCKKYYEANNLGGRVELSDKIICISESDLVNGNIPNGANSSVSSISGYFWSSSEVSSFAALGRNILSYGSSWYAYGRGAYDQPLCVGD